MKIISQINIPGPPGSGKTTTIMGLISTFLKTNQATLITVPGSTSQAKKPRNRLLVCAPSNAAIDEIVRRLKQGIRDGKGGTFVPKMVRLGTSDAIHSAVRDVTLDALVDIELKANPQYAFKDADEEEGRSEDVRRRIAILKDDRESLRARESGSNDASEAKEINDKIATISKRLGALQDELVKEKEKRGTSALARDRFRRACRLKLLSESDVILSTLSASGHDVLAEINELEFPTVIIDEACQSVELSTLIPLRYGAKKCILVGDPNQLPPTVLSTVAQEYGYERSLFERIMNNNPQSVHLLRYVSYCSKQRASSDSPSLTVVFSIGCIPTYLVSPVRRSMAVILRMRQIWNAIAKQRGILTSHFLLTTCMIYLKDVKRRAKDILISIR